MPHIPDIRAHATHDPELIAAYAAGDATGDALDTAAALVAGCAACADLHRDLRAIAAALPVLPAPVRRRDFRLTEADAARLRPRGWRALVDVLAGPSFRLAAPLGTGLAALGLAGILVGTGFPIGSPGTAVQAPAAGGPSATVLNGSGGSADTVEAPDLAAGGAAPEAAGSAPAASAAPAASPAPASEAPVAAVPQPALPSEAPSVPADLRAAGGPGATRVPGATLVPAPTGAPDGQPYQAFGAASPGTGLTGTASGPTATGPVAGDDRAMPPATRLAAPGAGGSTAWPAIVLLVIGLVLLAVRLAARRLAGGRLA